MSLETDIQSLKTTIASIGNKVEGVLDIFMEGGVANADWASLKGELQGWVQSQEFAKLGAQQVFTNEMQFNNLRYLHYTRSGSVLFIQKAALKEYDGSIAPSNTDYTYINFCGYDEQNRDFYSGNSVGNLHHTVRKNSDTSWQHETSIEAIMPNASSSIAAIVQNDGIAYGVAPTYSGDDADNSTKIVTTGFLHRPNNGLARTDRVTTFNKKVYLDFPYLEHRYNGNMGIGSMLLETHFGDDLADKNYYYFFDINGDNLEYPNNPLNGYGFCRMQWTVRGKAAGNSEFGTGTDVTFELHNPLAKTEDEYEQKVFASLRCRPAHNGGVNQSCFVINVPIIPIIDNSISLGDVDFRFSQLYAATGAINTSDERYKTKIEDIPENVFRAWGKVKFKQFKFKDSVAEKGSSNARIHVGVIANNLAYSILEAFKSEGLDATRYGLLCYDEWNARYENEEVIDQPAQYEDVKIIDTPEIKKTVLKNGIEYEEVVQEETSHIERREISSEKKHIEVKKISDAGNRYSVRYSECLAMECAYQRYRLEKIEKKLGI